MRRKLSIVVLIVASILPLHAGIADDVGAAATPIPVYVFAGQSNMVGAWARTAELPAHDPALTLPNKQALFWGPTTDTARRWAAIEPPTEIWQNIVKSGFGPEVSAARELTKLHPGGTIGIVKFARNGSNLVYQWDPDNPFSYFQHLKARVYYARRALTELTGRPTRVAGFFWMQGESDAIKKVYADAYGRNLTRLITVARRDFGNPRLPVVLGRIRDYRTFYKHTPYTDIVRHHQMKVAAADPYTFLVMTEGLPFDADGLHFNARGTAQLGMRMVQSRFKL